MLRQCCVGLRLRVGLQADIAKDGEYSSTATHPCLYFMRKSKTISNRLMTHKPIKTSLTESRVKYENSRVKYSPLN